MAKAKRPSTPRIENRRARHDYFIDEEVEAGIVLTGTEVKSLRAGKANLQDAYAGEQDGEFWLFNSYIAEYEGGNRFNHASRRPRKLLLHRRQIARLTGLVSAKGYTVVPLYMYFTSRGYVKLLLGAARGKKQYDKRETEKKRDWEREKARLLRQ
jgi:SsrA-binding protein